MGRVRTKCTDNGKELECEVEYDWKEISEEERELPKNKIGIKIAMGVNSHDAEVIREALKKTGHHRLAEDFETKREIEIMKEVKKNGGIWGGGIEKTLEIWRKGNYYESIDTKEPKYKMKHRVLNATKG
jgi:hypothetical protein